MRFSIGHFVEHPDFVLLGKILVVNNIECCYIIEDLYTGKVSCYADDDANLQLYPHQGFMPTTDSAAPDG